MSTARHTAAPSTSAGAFAPLGALLERLEAVHIRLYLDTAGALRYQGPRGAMTAEGRRDLTAHKGALSRALRSAGAIGDGPAAATAVDACRNPAHPAPRYSYTLGRWLCRECEPDVYALFALAVARAAMELQPAARLEASVMPASAIADRETAHRRAWIAKARRELETWGEAHGWPGLPLAFSAGNSAGYVQPFASVIPGADAWARFLASASGPDLAAACRAAGLLACEALTPAPAPAPAPAPRHDETPATSPAERVQEAGQRDRAADVRDWPETFAALDTGALWIARVSGRGDAGADPTRRELDELSRPEGATARRLVELMEREGITQLWVHPTWARSAGLPMRPMGQREAHTGIADPFAAAEWASDASPAGAWGMQRPGHLRPWMKFYRRGESGTIALAVPHLETRAPWGEAPDARTLLAAVLAYRAALGGFAYRSGPGATGTGLIRALHRGNRTALDLSASLTPADFPAPARIPALTPQLAWIRELTPEERERGRYVHAYDKNGMFLAACSSLRCGFGLPEHLAASDPDTGDELAAAVEALTDMESHPRPARPVGYWLARVTGYAGPAGLPHPCYPARDPETRHNWYATPTLVLALEEGATLDVREAYVWRETHEPLEPWYQRLRDARASLLAASEGEPRTAAPALALAAVKATYTQGIGWLDPRWLRESEEPEDLYRPDWRHMAIATANANLWRNAAKAIRAGGPAPFAALTDCWYYVAEDPDPVGAAPPGLRRGEGLGQYKAGETGVCVADLAPVGEALAHGRRPNVVAGMLARVISGRDVEDAGSED